MKFKNHKFNTLIGVILFAIGFLFSCQIDDELVPKSLEQYKTELSEIVSSEIVDVSNCVMGYDKGNFKIDTLLYFEATTDYRNALKSADSILLLNELTIKEVMNANYLISKPGHTYHSNIWISDRRPLHEAIVYCDTLRVHTPEGTEPGMAPKEARDKFVDAILVAKRIRGSSATIDRQVTAATEELTLELELFQNAIIK